MDHLALLRYRWRLFRYRLRFPGAFETVTFALSLVGIWSLVQYVAGLVVEGNLAVRVGSALALLAILAATWFSLAHRPQAVFAEAARTEDRARSLREHLRSGMQVDQGYENLLQIYRPFLEDLQALWPDRSPAMPIDMNGLPFLVVTLPAGPGDTMNDIVDLDDSPRDANWQQRASRFAAERQQFITTLRGDANYRNRIGDEDGETVVLSSITVAPRLRLWCRRATYGQVVRTSDSLVQEFALMGYLCGLKPQRPLKLSARATMSVLPWRRAVHRWERDSHRVLTRPVGRAAGVGVSLAVLHGRTKAYVARRSARVGTYPDVLHVVPSGMLPPSAPHPGEGGGAPSSLVETTMMAEFLEECYDVEELGGRPVSSATTVIHRHLQKRGLAGVRPRLTGLAIDLLNLRVEICGLLDLTGQESALSELQLCWEYADHSPLRSTGLDAETVALSRSEVVQAGAGCLDLARRDVGTHL